MVTELIKLTKKVLNQNEKIVIVSQWVNMLDNIKYIFNKCTKLKNVKSITLQGSNKNKFNDNKSSRPEPVKKSLKVNIDEVEEEADAAVF